MFRYSIFFVLLFISFATLASADDSPKAAAESVDPVDVALLVKDLESPKFNVRRRASQQLHEMGKAAFGALEKAAQSDSRETVTRCVDILQNHFENGDAETQAAAKESLGRLAASQSERAARLAKQALKPKEEQKPANPFGGNPFGAGRVQIQVQAIGGNNRNMKVKVVNGVKDIEVQENDLKVKIHEDPNNGIKVEVTEKVNGKEVTKKYEAKDEADLKKNHPEGHKVYEKYGKQNGGIQFRIGAKPFNLQPKQVPVVPPKDAKDAIEKSKQRLVEMLKRYKKQIEQTPADADQLKQVLERLEERIEQIEKIQSRVEGIQKEQEDTRKKLEEQRKKIENSLETKKAPKEA